MPARVKTSMSLIKRKSSVSRLKIPDKVSSYFIDLKFMVQVCVWEHVAQWLGFGLKIRGLGFDSKSWPCVEVSGKLRTPHCLGPPSRNGYLVHRSNLRSIVAGYIGVHLARRKVKSVERGLSWSIYSKQLPLSLPFVYLFTHRGK